STCFSIWFTILRVQSSVVCTTMVNLDTLSISDFETLRLSTLMCRFKNIPEILLSRPTLFSEYTEMVYHCFSIVLLLPSKAGGGECPPPDPGIGPAIFYCYLSRISETDAPAGTMGNTLSSRSTLTSKK